MVATASGVVGGAALEANRGSNDSPITVSPAMKVWAHSESHIVELGDGSRWQIFPGDVDLTLNWKPETEITIAPAEDDLASHVLVRGGARVRVIPEGESWPCGRSRTR